MGDELGITNLPDQSKLTNSNCNTVKENKWTVRRIIAAIERLATRSDNIEKELQKHKSCQKKACLEQTRRFERMFDEARKEARDERALLEEKQEEDNQAANEKIKQLERELTRQIENMDEKMNTFEEELQAMNERTESNAREIEEMKQHMDKIDLEHNRHMESVDRKFEEMRTERLNDKAMRITARVFLDKNFPDCHGSDTKYDVYRKDEEAKKMRLVLEVEVPRNMDLFEQLGDLIGRDNARPNEVMKHLPRIVGNNPALGAMIQNSCAAVHDITNTNAEMSF